MKQKNIKFMMLLIVVSISAVFASGCVSSNQTTTTTEPTTLGTTTTVCQSLYWFDNNHLTCGYQQFCGAYMYLGLHTFETLDECDNALNQTLNNEYIIITSAPTAANTNSSFVISWYINSTPAQIHNTAILYGPSSVPNPTSFASYPYASTTLCAGTPCDVPGPFTLQMLIANPGIYYYRAHAVVSGLDIWSDERSINITAPVGPIVRQFMADADDYGFYSNGSSLSQVLVNKNDLVNITIHVNTNNVYHGGLDFRGCGHNTTALPGQNATIQFIAGVNCPISSYWPSTGVLKATITVVVI